MATRTVVAGELYESITGQLFEIARQLRQKGGYPYDPHQLRRVLQDAIEGKFPGRKWKLDLHPTQRDGGVIQGWDLEKHYDSPEFNGRHYSLESPEVKGWIANPTTYPDEFKGKAVFLWGSRQGSGGDREVACLIWLGDRVRVAWHWLDYDWDRPYPALLAVPSDS